MAPYREKKQGTPSNGFPHLDPLEVTRTTSNNSEISMPPDSPSGSRISMNLAVLECDYDTNPTVLYQAIEAKQWDYAISLLEGTKKPKTAELEKEASSTWVVRKESNGKLRWRLLPVHAAIIFGSPVRLIELLLADFPLGAQCKDDRGMLPLHLAFRCQASWDVVDELITTFPLGVFVSERKGRTPLKCVSKSMPANNNNNNNINNNNNNNNNNNTSTQSSVASIPSDPSSFRTVAGVLELYSQIVISGERKRVEQETRNLAATSIAQIQDSHHRQLEAMRKKMEAQKTEQKHQRDALEVENRTLRQKLENLEKELAERDQSHLDMTKKLKLTNVKLDLATERAEANDDGSIASQNKHPKSVDKMLRMMAETMVRQQKAYHGRVQKLLNNYQELVAEREQMKSIFEKNSNINQHKEAVMLESFRNWFREEDKKLMMQERSLLIPSSPASSVDCRTDFLKTPTSASITPKSLKTPRLDAVPTISSKTIAAKKPPTPTTPTLIKKVARTIPTAPAIPRLDKEWPSPTSEPREEPA